VEVSNGQLVLTLVSVDIGQVGEGVAHAEDGVEALGPFWHTDVVRKSKPVRFINDYY